MSLYGFSRSSHEESFLLSTHDCRNFDDLIDLKDLEGGGGLASLDAEEDKSAAVDAVFATTTTMTCRRSYFDRAREAINDVRLTASTVSATEDSVRSDSEHENGLPEPEQEVGAANTWASSLAVSLTARLSISGEFPKDSLPSSHQEIDGGENQSSSYSNVLPTLTSKSSETYSIFDGISLTGESNPIGLDHSLLNTDETKQVEEESNRLLPLSSPCQCNDANAFFDGFSTDVDCKNQSPPSLPSGSQSTNHEFAHGYGSSSIERQHDARHLVVHTQCYYTTPTGSLHHGRTFPFSTFSESSFPMNVNTSTKGCDTPSFNLVNGATNNGVQREGFPVLVGNKINSFHPIADGECETASHSSDAGSFPESESENALHKVLYESLIHLAEF